MNEDSNSLSPHTPFPPALGTVHHEDAYERSNTGEGKVEKQAKTGGIRQTVNKERVRKQNKNWEIFYLVTGILKYCFYFIFILDNDSIDEYCFKMHIFKRPNVP